MSECHQLREDFLRILDKLDEVLAIPSSIRTTRDRDSAILRFELTFEVCWKLLQRMVRDEGFESNGPRQAFERSFSIGWISNESVWYDLLKDRNLAIHVYREEWAEDLFGRLPVYLQAFKDLAANLPEV
ncbi:MAG: HI0074 family nucleotidyltransferase substrate-binding subunit [Oceanipulchritudo sp.]